MLGSGVYTSAWLGHPCAHNHITKEVTDVIACLHVCESLPVPPYRPTLSNCWNPTWSTIILKFFFFFFSVENVLSFFRSFSTLSFSTLRFLFEVGVGVSGGGNPVVYNGRHARASVPAEGRKTKYIREDPEEEDEDQERQELGLPQRKNKPQSRVSSLQGNTPALT